MVHYGLLITGLLTAATLSVAFPQGGKPTGLYTFPTEGLPDGVYLVDADEDGKTRFEGIEFVPMSNATESHGSSQVARELTTRGGGGAHCGSEDVDYYSAAQAEQKFKEFCDSGRKWEGKSIVFTYDRAFAYGCNYGNGQYCYYNTLEDWFGQIDRLCGESKGGFYSDTAHKVGYGRSVAGHGFC